MGAAQKHRLYHVTGGDHAGGSSTVANVAIAMANVTSQRWCIALQNGRRQSLFSQLYRAPNCFMSTKTSSADGPLPHTYRQSHPLLSAETIARMKPEERSHFLDTEAKRNTLSLGDTVGLEHLGVHLVRVPPGSPSTVLHWHTGDEEWIYVLSGRGMAEMTVLEGDLGAGVDGRSADDVEVETKDIGPGDFLGFKRSGRAHNLVNTGTEDLVYLLGGERNSHDQCTYPKLGKTLHIIREKGGTGGGIVDNEHIQFWKRA
ncbi:hypothetical protein SpCBS45565_g02569 [Spizellomyces sp. 'palustris']|nr:hypothetical protein SpCBS45565_g02569 [Spizellomyces sp. 'palustris']